MQIQVVTYKNPKEYSKDAEKRALEGWTPSGQTQNQEHIAIGRTVGKTLLTGGLGLLFSGRAHKDGGITVTWMRDEETAAAHPGLKTWQEKLLEFAAEKERRKSEKNQ